MRCRDVKHWLTVQRDSHLARPAEDDVPESSLYCSSNRAEERCQGQDDLLLVTPPSRTYPSISTERIMYAVEQQRRITQELEDLRTQQKQRTTFLRTTGLKLVVGMSLVSGLLAVVCAALAFFRPDILVRTLTLLSGAIALLVTVEEDLKTELALIPLNSWLLSVAALAIVLMMGLWLRLMRHPREA